MIGAMGFAVVLADGFMLTMGDASLAFFAFGLFAMLNAIMLDRFYRGLMIGTMLWLHFRRSQCWRYNRCNNCSTSRRNSGGCCRSRYRAFFSGSAAD